MFRKFNFDTEWAVRLISSMTNDDIPIEGHTIVKQVTELHKFNNFLLWFKMVWLALEDTIWHTLVCITQLLGLQINAEKYFFGIRKSLVEFDEVLEASALYVVLFLLLI